MSADELRARFSDLAEHVVPMEDPHGRLMSRRRKRFRARVASLATVTAAVVVGGVAAPSTMLSFGVRPELPPDVAVQSSAAVTAEEYLVRLVNAPVRGNLSNDKERVAEVQKAFSEFAPKYDGAKDPNLVFLNQTDQMLQAVVIYTGGAQPIAVARGSQPEGSIKDLLSDPFSYSAPATQFLVMPISDQSGKAKGVVGLAPPGCAIEHSSKAAFTDDGAWVRTYGSEPTGDYIIRDGSTVNELWRVSCDGKIREVRIADDYLDSFGVDDDGAEMYRRAVGFSGFPAAKNGIVQWRGKLPGTKYEGILVAPRPLPGPAMLAVGPFAKSVLVTDLPDNRPVPSPSGEDASRSMIALGVAGEGVTAVRVPELLGDRMVLGDQVFVYTDTSAGRVEALDPKRRVVATAPVSQGVAILTFGPGLADAVRVVTSRDTTTSSVRFIELAEGSRVLGDQLLKDW